MRTVILWLCVFFHGLFDLMAGIRAARYTGRGADQGKMVTAMALMMTIPNWIHWVALVMLIPSLKCGSQPLTP